jgi:transposase
LIKAKPKEEEMEGKRRVVGIDLAMNSFHNAAIMEWGGHFHCKSFRFKTSKEGIEALLKRAEHDSYELTFIMEPTGMAWVPLATAFMTRGHKVYLVSPQKASDLRKYYKKHTKTDRVDAQVLARLLIVDPDGLNEFRLSPAKLTSLERYSKQRDKIVSSISGRKARIQSIIAAVIPDLMKVFGSDKFTKTSRNILREFTNPFKVEKLGLKGLKKHLSKHSDNKAEEGLVEKVYRTCKEACEVYREAYKTGRMPFDYEQIQQEINTELDLMEFEESKVIEIQDKMKALYKEIDPEGILKTIKGIGEVNAAAIVGATGEAERFRNVRAYKAYCGLIPKKKQSSDKDKKGLSVRKNADWLLKKTYYMAAETARRWDVEFAAFYKRLRDRGLHHNQAMCALANKLSARVFALMKRINMVRQGTINAEQAVYNMRDMNGNTISATMARQIIEEQYLLRKGAKKQIQLEEVGIC